MTRERKSRWYRKGPSERARARWYIMQEMATKKEVEVEGEGKQIGDGKL